MKAQNFSYSFKTSKTAEDVFELLQNIDQWWSGLYQETIQGKSRRIKDEFTFHAGDGAHYSKQQLIELIPGEKIAWLVTDSKLSFLSHPTEWNDTKIMFELSQDGTETNVRFTHDGLVPQIECYEACSSAWTGYMDNLKKKLN